ncbi:MAG: hypothetical protein ACJAVF_000928 [Paraglaciecola sp.]
MKGKKFKKRIKSTILTPSFCMCPQGGQYKA